MPWCVYCSRLSWSCVWWPLRLDMNGNRDLLVMALVGAVVAVVYAVLKFEILSLGRELDSLSLKVRYLET